MAEQLQRGTRGVSANIAMLRALEAAERLEYVRMEAPDTTARTPRYYVVRVAYNQPEIKITGAEFRSWVEGFKAACTSCGYEVD